MNCNKEMTMIGSSIMHYTEGMSTRNCTRPHRYVSTTENRLEKKKDRKNVIMGYFKVLSWYLPDRQQETV
jgi:hypothetical protein